MSSRSTLSLFSCTVSVGLWAAVVWATQGAVPQGSPEQATAYYRELAGTIGFSTPETILESTLDDVPKYLGFSGLSAQDLERLAPAILMDARLGQPCAEPTPCGTAIRDVEAFRRGFLTFPMRPGDILASRFLAPKIANVSESGETRKLGWRKLIRFNAQRGSPAARNRISQGIILFNFFTAPGEKPFEPGAASVNTQVMLVSARPVRDRDTLYWLDYEPLPAGGKLSLKLDAAFDAGDLQADPKAIKEYFVPNGCVACHGEVANKPMINYLDTDHWFDRLNDDFIRVRDEKLPVLFDGGIDTNQPEFAQAFDAIRRFNEEAEVQASIAQPKSFHLRAGRNWVRLHRDTNEHIPPASRGVGSQWGEGDRELIGALNRYCFRCHGTIKFNVFERHEVFSRRGNIANRLRPTAEQLRANPSFLMPPDRKLLDEERDRLIQLLRSMESR